MGILYLSTKFQLERGINNGDLSADRNLWKHRLNLISSPYSKKGRVKTGGVCILSVLIAFFFFATN